MNDTDKLMICAKAAGRKNIRFHEAHPPDELGMGNSAYITVDIATKYDPRTNDAQAFELLRVLAEKEGHTVHVCQYSTGWSIEIYDCEVFGQTLNEAIINAIVASKGEGHE